MANFIVLLDSHPLLHKSFHEVDRHHDGAIDQTELRDSLVQHMQFTSKQAELAAR